MSTDGLDAYQRSVGDLTIERLQTDHDLGQRTNPEPLHSAIGALLDIGRSKLRQLTLREPEGRMV